MTYEKRWDEKRWAGIRWEELRWDEVWRVKCGAWSVKCGVWSVKCGVWSVKCGVWSVKCGLWSVKCGVWSVKCEVWSVQWEACSVSVECGVWSVKCGVWSVKCEVELQMWHVKQDTTFAECTHARAWLAHGACKFYRWERSYNISLRQLPPRLVRVLLVPILSYIYYIYIHILSVYIYVYIYIHLYGIVSNALTTTNSIGNWINHRNSRGDLTDWWLVGRSIPKILRTGGVLEMRGL